ncbi:hypothetical protein ACVWXM_009991 [Bradyrhizobium sp. GM7.3]
MVAGQLSFFGVGTNLPLQPVGLKLRSAVAAASHAIAVEQIEQKQSARRRDSPAVQRQCPSTSPKLREVDACERPRP